ncbi:MAG: membrane protein insertase YidC [Erysipelotrichaceae bacterium]|nr:membrane protein insertase YidC [Erysipelotrichaceae bacterium]
MKFNKKSKRLLLLIAVVMLLAGCGRITGADGRVLPEKIISLSTTFTHMLNEEGWFEAIFVWPFAQLINFFAQYMNVAFSVIVVTILSRLVILPLTIKSTVSMQKLQMIQPELNKIQKKYEGKDDDYSKMKMSQEMMNLYTKHNINPLSSLFGTFLNFPIMIAIWQAVQRADSVINGSFLGLNMQELPWNAVTTDLSSSWGYIILIVILAAVQWISMKLPTYLARKDLKERERRAAEANDKSSQMMNIMFVMIIVMSINMPAAMSFYWIVSGAVQMLQTVFIQKRYVK